MLKNVTGNPEFNNMKKIIVGNQTEVEYVEQYDNNSKYERDQKKKYLC